MSTTTNPEGCLCNVYLTYFNHKKYLSHLTLFYPIVQWPHDTQTEYSPLHCTTLHCTALYCIAPHCTTLACPALHWTELNCTALYCTALLLSLDVTVRVTGATPTWQSWGWHLWAEEGWSDMFWIVSLLFSIFFFMKLCWFLCFQTMLSLFKLRLKWISECWRFAKCWKNVFLIFKHNLNVE